MASASSWSIRSGRLLLVLQGLLAVVACSESAESAPEALDAGVTDTIDAGDASAMADVDAAPRPALPFEGGAITALRYEEGNYPQTYDLLTFDLVALTGTRLTGDGGTESFTIASADAEKLRADVVGLPVVGLSTTCSGNDGLRQTLFVETPRGNTVLSHEVVCSPGPKVDVVVEKPGYVRLRTEFYRVAGLPVPQRA